MLTRYGERGLVWIDLVAPTQDEVHALMREFDLDPLVAQELLLPSFKPKVERRGDSLYVILHFPTLRAGLSQRAEQEIDFVLGKNFLITTRYETIDPLHSFAKVFEVQSVLRQGHSHTHGGHLFVSMVRELYAALVFECDTLAERLRDTEEHIFNGEEKRMVVELSHIGKAIHDFRRALVPHREMLASLDPAGSRFFGQEFSYYVRSLEGSAARVHETLENLRGSLVELRETNNSLLSTKHNDISKSLTMMAFMTFPLTLLATLFAMRTESTPLIGFPGDFWVIVAGMFLILLGFFGFFKYKNGSKEC